MLSNRWTVLAVLFIARISMGFQFQSVTSVTPFLVDELGLSYVEIGTLIGVFMLPGVLIALPGGYLGKRLGDQRLCWSGLALMVAGGLVFAVSPSYSVAIAGRLISGTGAVLFNVVVTKMVSDWFADKEIVTAMGVILGSWPLGIALALVIQSAVAAASSWQAVMYLTALACAGSFVLVISLYRRPPHRSEYPGEAGNSFKIPWRELLPVSMAGLAWGFFNIGMVVFFSFSPGLLTSQGMSAVDAGTLVSIGLWINLLSVPLGGYLIERLSRPMSAAALLTLTAAAGLFLMPYVPAPVILVVLVGLGVAAAGPIVALPSRALSPENLGPGLGIFFAWYYGAVAVGPFLAGLGQDLTGSAATPVVLGGGAFVVAVVFMGLFQVFQAKNPVAAARAG